MLNVNYAVLMLPLTDPDKYPVYPEDDGTDRPRNPYSPVCNGIYQGLAKFGCGLAGIYYEEEP